MRNSTQDARPGGRRTAELSSLLLRRVKPDAGGRAAATCHPMAMAVPNPFNRADYLLAAHTHRQLPPDGGSEVAFAGRSNAGKSSALNALCQRNALARVSKTPGRTQQLVYFGLPP